MKLVPKKMRNRIAELRAERSPAPLVALTPAGEVRARLHRASDVAGNLRRRLADLENLGRAVYPDEIRSMLTKAEELETCLLGVERAAQAI